MPCAPRVHHPRWLPACRSHAASLLKEFCSCRHARHTPRADVNESNDHGCMSAEAHLQAHSSRHGSRDGHRSQSSLKTKLLQAALHPSAPTFHERQRSFGAAGTNSSRARWTLAMRNRSWHSSQCRHGVGCGVRQPALEEFAPATVGVDRTPRRPRNRQRAWPRQNAVCGPPRNDSYISLTYDNYTIGPQLSPRASCGRRRRDVRHVQRRAVTRADQ